MNDDHDQGSLKKDLLHTLSGGDMAVVLWKSFSMSQERTKSTKINFSSPETVQRRRGVLPCVGVGFKRFVPSLSKPWVSRTRLLLAVLLHRAF